jgi:hypothetical protein
MTCLTLRCALRARPARCQFIGGAEGILLQVKDTTGLIEDSFVACLRGNAGLDLLRLHSADLIPGRCVDLQLIRLRAVHDGLRADVLQCSLAPLAPSWQAHSHPPASEPTDSAF